MTNATDILVEATRRRIRLVPNGPRLVVKSIGELPQDFEQVLIRHKPDLLKLLNAKRHLAKQVLQGEFNEPLAGRLFGLICSELAIQYYADPLCARAFEHLRAARIQAPQK